MAEPEQDSEDVVMDDAEQHHISILQYPVA